MKRLTKVRTLYICYFGLKEPLVQTQVLPYLRQIVSEGAEVNLLTFEPKGSRMLKADIADGEAGALRSEGIEWSFLRYHKWPSLPATVYDVFRGIFRILWLGRARKLNVLHARSHIPVLMALVSRSFLRCRVIFDIRGFVADEYLDAGVWSADSVPYRLVKRLESWGIRSADQLVVLTEKAKKYISGEFGKEEVKITVVPCCVDFSRVKEDVTAAKGERFELVYAGSVVGLYLLEEMSAFFLELKKIVPDAFFKILTSSDPATVSERMVAHGMAPEDLSVAYVEPGELISEIGSSSIAISFRKPTFAQIAASPTKIPEYLAAGLVVVSNTGIGDTDETLRENRVGVLVDEFTPEAYRKAAREVLGIIDDPEVSDRCRQTASKGFDVEIVGRSGYASAYERISSEF